MSETESVRKFQNLVLEFFKTKRQKLKVSVQCERCQKLKVSEIFKIEVLETERIRNIQNPVC